MPIVGDVKRVLEQAQQGAARDSSRPTERNAAARRAWWTQIRAWKAEHPLEPEFSDTEIKPQHLMAEIDRLSGGEAIVSSDVGQHQMWAAQLIRFNEPRLWLNSGGLGSMGFGLPAAIGAQFARPDKLVFAIVGRRRIPDVDSRSWPRSPITALPIKIIVMNNGYLGMVRQWQELFYNNRLSAGGTGFVPGRRKSWPALTDSRAARWKSREHLRAALEAAVARAGSLPAERAGVAVRERLSDGAGRRRDQRNGAGTAAAGGGVRRKDACCN